MDKKLTDNEIKKALECCKDEEVDCDKCPYNAKNKCVGVLLQNALDYINRLEVENERLQKYYDNMEDAIYSFREDHAKVKFFKKEIKAEAIKEFAERLKENQRYAKDVFDHTTELVVRVEDIDKVLEETE